MADWTDHGQGSTPHSSGSAWTDAERAWGHSQVDKKRKLRAGVVAYIVINIFLIGLWALTEVISTRSA